MSMIRASVLMCCVASIDSMCLGQVTPLVTRRATSASARGDTVFQNGTDADASLGHFRSIRTACVTTPLGNTGCVVGTQESGIGEERFWAVGQGGASTTPGFHASRQPAR